MKQNKFTQEQVGHLRLSPYVQSVSETTIRYSDDLRELYYQQKDQYKSGRDWLRSVGLGPEVIGIKRVSNLITQLNSHSDFESYLASKESKKDSQKMSDKERIKFLEHKLNYVKQENKFLKKNMWIDQMQDID